MEETAEKSINWGRIIASAIITAIITGLVAVTTGTILFRLQTKEPKLVYAVPETTPFSGMERGFAIYTFTIANPGSRPVSDVLAVATVPSAALEQVGVVADATLHYAQRIVGDRLEIKIPELAPGDKISVSLLATGKTTLPSSPQLSVRGSGIVGIKADLPERNPPSLLASILPTVVGAYVVLAGAAAVYLVVKRGTFDVISGKHREVQNQVMAYLCGLHGLIDDVQEYLSRPPGSTSYWAEADRLAAIALVNPGSEQAEKRKNVLKNLLDYASMADLSRAITHYDIARIAFAQGKVDEAKTNLTRARQYGPRLIKIRLTLESDLRTLLESEKALIR